MLLFFGRKIFEINILNVDLKSTFIGQKVLNSYGHLKNIHKNAKSPKNTFENVSFRLESPLRKYVWTEGLFKKSVIYENILKIQDY